MKDEDETFRILSQRPYGETYKALQSEIKRSNKIIYCEKRMTEVLSKHGWTMEEFSNRIVSENKTLV
jgi:hypothetical protein